ncbi:TPA: hypothetical protein HA265_01885 [Candidatus Woesearchaeota archaeon]|nr:hypothetical protein [Candidatus Woesearchaeota archaeon]
MARSLTGKARGLERLVESTSLGYTVPEHRTIDLTYFEIMEKQKQMAALASVLSGKPYVPTRLPSHFNDIVSDMLAHFDGRQVIVRSSSLHEDGENSFAGIYESFVVSEPDTEKLAEAIFKVYASMNTRKAIQYRKEHGVEDDKMEVILQEYVEPEWKGVMYTSNPSYPDDLTIEFTDSEGSVVDGTGNSFIVDFDKKTGECVFRSENYQNEFLFKPPFDADELAQIGIELEKLNGASDIEFAVKDGKLHLLQSRPITDLEEPEDVEIPDYKPEQYIGSTKVRRGKGKVTLPVVRVEDFSQFVRKIDMLREINPDIHKEALEHYFHGVMDDDRRYKKGYVLLMPHFRETGMDMYSLFVRNIPDDPTADNLTPHKKAVITTNCNLLASHAMTVAREKGVAYAGFRSSEDMFGDVATGDVVSIYFKGREAHVYREERTLTIKDTRPDVSFEVIEEEDGTIHFRGSEDFGPLAEPYVADMLRFLNERGYYTWTYESNRGVMGGRFTNEHGEQLVLHMSRSVGSSTAWRFAPVSYCRAQGIDTLTEKELEDITLEYANYLDS